MSMDPELNAMRYVAEALNDLDRGARKRVLNWAWHKFVPPVMLDLSGAPHSLTDQVEDDQDEQIG
jgi:hypothetical protein